MEYKDMTKELMEKLEWAFGCGFNVKIVDKTKRKQPLVKTHKGVKYTASYLPSGELAEIYLVSSKKQYDISCLDLKSNNAKDYIDYFIENKMI